MGKVPVKKVEPEEEEQSFSLDKYPTSEDYFIIETYHDDWVYVVGKFLQAHKGYKIKEGFMIVGQGGTPTYFLAKSYFKADEIGKLLGITPEVAMTAKVLKLRPMGKQEDWQKPTVDYIGEA